MADPHIIAIRIRRGDIVFHVHGQDAGKEGVWLAKGQVRGIYDAPIKSTWKTGAFQRGSTQKAVKWLHRDMDLGFHIVDITQSDGTSASYEWNESMFRQIFFYEEDRWSTAPIPTTIEVDTEMYGTRKIDVLMREEPEFTSDIDPIKRQYGNIILKLRAADPYWYEEPDVKTFESEAGQSADTILVWNPTDQIMYQKWIVTPATWTLPDFQWTGDPGDRTPGGDNAARYIEDIEITTTNGGAVIDTDRQELMFRDKNNTNIMGKMGGNHIFTYPIPPYTPEQYVPVSYKGAGASGAACQLVMPRNWSRPWGLEGVTVVAPIQPDDVTTRFSYPGSYSYRIPDWCDRLDIVCVGGGGGGEGGGLLVTGAGGDAASWAYQTVIRGTDIPWDTYYIKGVVGEGGRGGRGIDIDWNWDDFSQDYWGGVDGEDGENTTAVASGMATVESAGGAGGTADNVFGEGLADLEFNEKTYPGCGAELTPGNRGNHPGGGGAGGWPLINAGGKGGRGQVWIRAYGWAGS